MGYSRKRKGSEESEDEVPMKKSKGSGSVPVKQTGEDGNPYWELSGKRRLQISEFKGKTMVNIREFYEKDGKSLPGKAGINMPIDQFQTLLTLLPQVLEELSDKGIEVEMPGLAATKSKHFSKSASDDEEEVESKPKKSNIEATSDEDEDA